MSKVLKHFRISILITALIEAILIIAACLFWWFDWFSFKSYVTTGYLMLFVSTLAVFDLFYFWFALMKINHLRQKNDIETASLVSSDIQEAYDFGQIGLVVVDEHGTIMWNNSLFKERNIELVDMSVYDWLPVLKDLVNAPANKVLHGVEIKGSNFDVKYLSEPRLFIFKDTTKYDNIVNYSQEQALCLGIVMIDNFNDVASETDESADMVNKIRNVITDYFRSFGVLLRRVRNDTYFAVCIFSSLNKLEKDGFSVLEKVRAAGKGEENPLTLSLGFAHDFPDVGKLNEMATSAVDVALSRGGDQAVVSQYGAELKFFGGKSAAFESTSKVKVRSIADSLISLIKSSSSVYIMGHTDLDMDALGSCLGAMAICDWCKKRSKIIYNPKQAEKKTRIAFQEAFRKERLDKITISPEDAVSEIKSSSLLIVTDVSVPKLTMCPKILEKAQKIIIIDHHRRSTEFIERPVLTYIEPSASSASELFAMMIRYATANPRIDVSPEFATLMLSGIFLDSNFFKSKSTGMRTFEAAEILKNYGADNSKADDYLKDDYEEYVLINRIISSMVSPSYGIVYCTAEEDDCIESATISKVANNLLHLKRINACFVIGRIDQKTIKLSARSDGTINVQLLAEKMGGGGHFTMAAAVFPNSTIKKVEETLNDTLEDYLEVARNSVNTEGD